MKRWQWDRYTSGRLYRQPETKADILDWGQLSAYKLSQKVHVLLKVPLQCVRRVEMSKHEALIYFLSLRQVMYLILFAQPKGAHIRLIDWLVFNANVSSYFSYLGPLSEGKFNHISIPYGIPLGIAKAGRIIIEIHQCLIVRLYKFKNHYFRSLKKHILAEN